MNILDRIFETKREEVAKAKATVSVHTLRESAAELPLIPFRNTLQNSDHPVALIAEVKKASPSKGLIRPDFDALQIAQTYKSAGADCLSVLTDISYFQGAPEYLQEIKREVTIPCLRKDFVYDSYQVDEARAWGADAVLLIAASLKPSQISDLKFHIESLGMDAFLEVHDEDEVELAVDQGFSFVGVNNRNLKNFKTDLNISGRLIPLLREGIPEATIVSESALETHDDILAVQKSGARAVLIGTTFCASPDIDAKVKEVMAW